MSALKSVRNFQEWDAGAFQVRRPAVSGQPLARSLAAALAETVAVDLPNGEVMAIDLGDVRRILLLL
jgi:hypothetical protein